MLDYLFAHLDLVGERTVRHLQVTAIAVVIAVMIGVPLGILVARWRRLEPLVLGVTGLLYTIPSLALFAFLLPLLGLGEKPTIVALILYSQLAIVRNTMVGIVGVDRAVIEAAHGMGMQRNQILRMVQLPLALPLIMAGIRTATVMDIGVATIAAFIGAGGLGVFIFQGISRLYPEMIVAGALPVAVLALLADFVLGIVERVVRPRGVGRA
ncbi:MAG: ABC transporter permease [Chloroflexi bacterium]|nr:ABC transporter permease [Chloroflexota bacterium]